MEKLINIQNKLNAPKNQRNNFGGYSYRSAEDILEALKPLLKEEKCSLVLKDDIVFIGDQDDARFYVKAIATLYNDDGTEIANSVAYAREPLDKKGMDASQITGATSSYARKYALNGLFCIDDNKDADTDEYHEQTKSSVEDVIKGMEYMTAGTTKKFYAKAIELYPKGTEEYKRWIEVWVAKKDALETKSDNDFLNQESEYLNNI